MSESQLLCCSASCASVHANAVPRAWLCCTPNLEPSASIPLGMRWVSSSRSFCPRLRSAQRTRSIYDNKPVIYLLIHIDTAHIRVHVVAVYKVQGIWQSYKNSIVLREPYSQHLPRSLSCLGHLHNLRRPHCASVVATMNSHKYEYLISKLTLYIVYSVQYTVVRCARTVYSYASLLICILYTKCISLLLYGVYTKQSTTVYFCHHLYRLGAYIEFTFYYKYEYNWSIRVFTYSLHFFQHALHDSIHLCTVGIAKWVSQH